MSPTKALSRFLIMLLLIPLASCIKSEDFDFDKMKDIEWNPKLAVPLVSSDLSIMDMIKQTGDSSNFVIDGQGFVTLVYKDRLFSIKPMDDFTIPTFNNNFTHTFTTIEAAALAANGSLDVDFPVEIKLTPADTVRIDSMIYAKGNFSVNISGTVNNNGLLLLNIPEAKKDGKEIRQTITPISNGTTNIDLTGYKFDLTQVSGKPSTIRLNARLALVHNASNPIVAGQRITMNVMLNTESIKSVSGYLGRYYLIDDKKTININLFNSALLQGQFNVVNPYMKFTFTNSIGLPVELNISELRGYNTTTGQSANLVGSAALAPLSPLTLDAPDYTATKSKVKSAQINNTGDALTNFMKVKPNSIVYNFNSLTNYNLPASNFLRDTSKLDIDVEVGLPLYGYIKDFAIQDTFDFKFNDISEIESMLIRTIIENEFPLEARMQVTFTDANYTPLDVLVTDDPIIIPAAVVNLTTGELTSSAKKTSNFIYPKTRINKIVGAEKILVKAILNTSGSATQNIKIFSTYKMKVKLAAQAEIKKTI